MLDSNGIDSWYTYNVYVCTNLFEEIKNAQKIFANAPISQCQWADKAKQLLVDQMIYIWMEVLKKENGNNNHEQVLCF